MWTRSITRACYRSSLGGCGSTRPSEAPESKTVQKIRCESGTSRNHARSCRAHLPARRGLGGSAPTNRATAKRQAQREALAPATAPEATFAARSAARPCDVRGRARAGGGRHPSRSACLRAHHARHRDRQLVGDHLAVHPRTGGRVHPDRGLGGARARVPGAAADPCRASLGRARRGDQRRRRQRHRARRGRARRSSRRTHRPAPRLPVGAGRSAPAWGGGGAGAGPPTGGAEAAGGGHGHRPADLRLPYLRSRAAPDGDDLRLGLVLTPAFLRARRRARAAAPRGFERAAGGVGLHLAGAACARRAPSKSADRK